MMSKFLVLVGAVALGLVAGGCKDSQAQDECAKFAAYANDSGARATAAVPMDQRPLAKTDAERAAWHRKLADAFEAESKAPAQFTTEKAKGYEARLKETYAKSAAALRKTADGFDKGDKGAVEQGQVDDTAASGARSELLKDWTANCTK